MNIELPKHEEVSLTTCSICRIGHYETDITTYVNNNNNNEPLIFMYWLNKSFNVWHCCFGLIINRNNVVHLGFCFKKRHLLLHKKQDVLSVLLGNRAVTIVHDQKENQIIKQNNDEIVRFAFDKLTLMCN